MELKKPERKDSSRKKRTGPARSAEKNRIYRHRGNWSWEGVRTERYKPLHAGWLSVVRRVLVGNKGERARFHVRYFEITSGGFTTLEMHRHEHAVIILRGHGRVRIGKRISEVGYLDTIFIKPCTPHQLQNPYQEPFGFLCIVNARRDKPVPLICPPDCRTDS